MKYRVEHVVYVFEGFRLDKGRRQLSSSGGVVVPLNSRAMEALVLLVSNAGELVTKKQLLQGVWPGAVVEDNNINQCILAIRKALRENAGSNRFIMTVPGRGYRFVAQVTAQTREAVEEVPAAPPRITVAWRTVVVPIVLVLALAGYGLSALQRPARAPAGDDRVSGLVVRLHRGGGQLATAESALILDCLRQRPDLHMKVEVRVVGAAGSPPLWEGEYIAGAEDLAPAPSQPQAGTRTQADGDDCSRLAAAR